MRTSRRPLAAGVGCTLLAAVFLCPLMATAAATPAASSCHDRPAQDHHGDGTPAFTCCATVVAVASIKAEPEADAALTPAVEHHSQSVHHTTWHAENARPRSASPPLFVWHASLLI
ncbi:MAG: hypothetical protein OXG72_20185 [Acidobacteria bacterium]|nr:hypothetical protein [Acidobacteriota bacterium]